MDIHGEFSKILIGMVAVRDRKTSKKNEVIKDRGKLIWKELEE